MEENELVTRKEVNLLLQAESSKQKYMWGLIQGFWVGVGFASVIWGLCAAICASPAQ